MSVEFTHVGELSSSDTTDEMVELMIKNGYEVRAKVTNSGKLANDYIFVKKGFNSDVELKSIHNVKELTK